MSVREWRYSLGGEVPSKKNSRVTCRRDGDNQLSSVLDLLVDVGANRPNRGHTRSKLGTAGSRQFSANPANPGKLGTGLELAWNRRIPRVRGRKKPHVAKGGEQ